MACRTTTVVKDVAIASRAEATHLRRRQAGPKTAPRGDPRPRRLDEMDVIHVGMRLFPDVDNKPRWPQIRQPIEAGAATGKADLRKAERRISGPAIAATPRVAQGLDLPDIVIARWPLPVESHAGRLVDKAVENHFRSRRIVTDRDIELPRWEIPNREAVVISRPARSGRRVEDERDDIGRETVAGKKAARSELTEKVLSFEPRSLQPDRCSRRVTPGSILGMPPWQ